MLNFKKCLIIFLFKTNHLIQFKSINSETKHLFSLKKINGQDILSFMCPIQFEFKSRSSANS